MKRAFDEALKDYTRDCDRELSDSEKETFEQGFLRGFGYNRRKQDTSNLSAELNGVESTLRALTIVFGSDCDRPSDHEISNILFGIAEHIRRIDKDLEQL